ncbi:cytochrome C biogenesis protein CcdA [Methanocella sp. CWC-04]|uniref:Cytochrome C biogenesis protein CcdA n=1 Tax=Methanooceanicella nereidis TaxID=2052831 RepID=A0AAP2RD87_9EURY|nr:cytochrome c biogenesis protein [Methanocella sp. CWC-04]MCD1294530.1 cytochrome C biogenesis protein CcdA [Methanocella sp. CWC-04]
MNLSKPFNQLIRKPLLLIALLLLLSQVFSIYTSSMPLTDAGGTGLKRDVNVIYIYSKSCFNCEQSEPVIRQTIEESQKSTGIRINLKETDFHSPEGMEYVRKFGISSVPAIIIDNHTVIRFEDFGGDTRELKEILKSKLGEAIKYKPPLEMERTVERIENERDIIRVQTCITNIGNEPLRINLSGGICEGVKIVSGDGSWSGTILPGERHCVTCNVTIDNNVKYLPAQVIEYIDSDGKQTIICPETPTMLIKKLSAITVFLAGLAAGVNPCLLAIMVFIATATLSSKGSHGEILIRILSFCAGLLVVYILMGIGFLTLLEYIPSFEEMIRTALIVILGLLSLWEFYDAYETYKYGSRDSVFKQFLRKFKPFYNKFHVIANFILGLVFGLIKMPCVGGIYIAILGAMIYTKDTGSLLAYLLIYNMGVILPLLFIGLIITLGMKPEKVDEFRHKHRVKIKVFTGIVLALLASAFLLGYL